VGRKKKIGAKKITLNPFEDELDLKAMLRIQRGDQNVGAYFCDKGSGRLRFTFGFDCQGIHSYLSSDQINALFDDLESGLRDLPPGELLTFHTGSFATDTERQQELKKLEENAPGDELSYLVNGERARTRELNRQGLRKPKFLRVYATCSIEPKTRGTQDWIEKVLARGQNFWHQFKGSAEEMHNQQLQEVLVQVAAEAKRWHHFVSDTLGLEVRPLDDHEMWKILWCRLNKSQPIPVPQLVILDDNGIREEINCETDAKSLLLAEAVPVVDRQWVQVKDAYIGGLTFLAKPGGWTDKSAQMRYFWTSAFACDDVSDTESFCQIALADQSAARVDAQRVLKQSNVVAFNAGKQRSIDVAAEVKVRRSVAAQEKMYEGEVVLRTAVTILVHRPSPEALSKACDQLERRFRKPAWVLREREYAWKLWLDTLNIVYDAQLVKPFARHKKYLSGEVLGLMSLVSTQIKDRQGLELIAEDGGSPIWVDIFSQHRNVAIFGATGSGKSVLVSYFMVQSLAHGWPVVGVDFPRSDGTSTYTDILGFLGDRASYFDITTGSNNLFQRPDLRQFPLEKQQERLNDFNDFLLSALMTLVVGKSDDQSLKKTTRSLLALALKAFNSNPEISRRYAAAIESGFGPLATHPAWYEVPTLRDFLRFCDSKLLKLDDISGDVHSAMAAIRLSIPFWIDSRVGRAIASPSSFPTDAQVIIYALRGLANDDDAAVCALSATAAALVKTLESSDSVFLLDEGSVLFEYEDLARTVGRFCATGRKSGMRVILISQDPNTIANSVAGEQIFQNIACKFTGRIESMAIKPFEQYFGYPRKLIANNASDAFFPKKAGIYSRWLLEYGGIFTVCRFYPAYRLLAVVANNMPEQAARNWFKQRYPDKIEAIDRFADYLVNWIRDGRRPFELTEAEPSTTLPVPALKTKEETYAASR